MSIDGISTSSLAQMTDSRSFGAVVIGKTFESLQDSRKTIPVDKAGFGMEVLDKTIDNLNVCPVCHHGLYNNSYEFQKDMLSPTYTGEGTLFKNEI